MRRGLTTTINLDEICDNLREIGVNARLTGYFPETEERRGFGWESMGLITIKQSLISWVNVRRQYTSDNEPPAYMTRCGVLDLRNLPKVTMRPTRIKTFPLFGKVINVRWDGDDHKLGFAESLSEDELIKTTIMKSNYYDLVVVRAYPEREYWLIETDV